MLGGIVLARFHWRYEHPTEPYVGSAMVEAWGRYGLVMAPWTGTGGDPVALVRSLPWDARRSGLKPNHWWEPVHPALSLNLTVPSRLLVELQGARFAAVRDPVGAALWDDRRDALVAELDRWWAAQERIARA